MFYHALAFNQSLNSWDTSKIELMDEAFDYAEDFDQDNARWYNFENN